MIIKHDGQSVSIDDFVTHSDLISYLDNIKPSDLNQLTGGVPSRYLTEKNYFKFDELTPKEVALQNFVYATSDLLKETRKRLLPTNKIELYEIAQSMGEDFPPPSVDSTVWADYSKLSYIYYAAKSYTDFLLYGRLGWEQFLIVAPNGQVHCLKDLRTIITERYPV